MEGREEEELREGGAEREGAWELYKGAEEETWRSRWRQMCFWCGERLKILG